MTALQEWLNDSPVIPRQLKALICDVIGDRSADEAKERPEPALMGRGLERC